MMLVMVLIALTLATSVYAGPLDFLNNLLSTATSSGVIVVIVNALALFAVGSIIFNLIKKEIKKEQTTIIQLGIAFFAFVIAWNMKDSGLFIWQVAGVSNFLHFPVIINTIIIGAGLLLLSEILLETQTTKDSKLKWLIRILIVIMALNFAMEPFADGKTWNEVKDTYEYVWKQPFLTKGKFFLFGASDCEDDTKEKGCYTADDVNAALSASSTKVNFDGERYGILTPKRIIIFMLLMLVIIAAFKAFMKKEMFGDKFIYALSFLIAGHMVNIGTNIAFAVIVAEIILSITLYKALKPEGTGRFAWVSKLFAGAFSVAIVEFAAMALFKGEDVKTFLYPIFETIKEEIMTITMGDLSIGGMIIKFLLFPITLFGKHPIVMSIITAIVILFFIIKKKKKEGVKALWREHLTTYISDRISRFREWSGLLKNAKIRALHGQMSEDVKKVIPLIMVLTDYCERASTYTEKMLACEITSEGAKVGKDTFYSMASYESLFKACPWPYSAIMKYTYLKCGTAGMVTEEKIREVLEKRGEVNEKDIEHLSTMKSFNFPYHVSKDYLHFGWVGANLVLSKMVGELNTLESTGLRTGKAGTVAELDNMSTNIQEALKMITKEKDKDEKEFYKYAKALGAITLIDSRRREVHDQWNVGASGYGACHPWKFANPDANLWKPHPTEEGHWIETNNKIGTWEKSKYGLMYWDVNWEGEVVHDLFEKNILKNRKKIRRIHPTDILDDATFSRVLSWGLFHWRAYIEELRTGIYHINSRTAEDYTKFLFGEGFKGRKIFGYRPDHWVPYSTGPAEKKFAFDKKALWNPAEFNYLGTERYWLHPADERHTAQMFNPYPCVSTRGISWFLKRFFEEKDIDKTEAQKRQDEQWLDLKVKEEPKRGADWLLKKFSHIEGKPEPDFGAKISDTD